MTERVVKAQGTSVRHVNKTPEDEYAEDRRSKGEAFPPRGEDGLHQQRRVSVGERNSGGWRARTPRRGQVTERVVKA